MFLGSILILTNLGAAWVIFVTGLLITWAIAMGFATPALLAGPPYLLNAAQIGWVSVGPVLGGWIGLMIGWTMDPFAKACARRNNGV